MKKTLIAGAVLASVISFAQIKEAEIDTVALQGRTKIKQERAEFRRHGQSTETLSEFELNRNNPAMIDQTLSTMSGVQVDKRTNFGGQRVVVRGYGNDQKFNNWGVKFYWNNMPLTNAEGVTVLDDVDFAYVNNIEVIKGPASTMYGGGTGGTVRFYTRPEFSKKISVSENILAGSFKTFQSRTQLNASDDNYSINTTFGHLETDGYRPNGQGLKNFFNVNGTVKISRKDQLSFFASQAYSNEGTSGQIPYADYYAGVDQGNIAYIRKGAGIKIKSTRVGLSNLYSFLPNFSNYTTLFFYNANTDRIAAGAFETASAPSVGLRSVFTLKNNLGSDFDNRLEFGTEVQNTVTTTSNYRFTGSVTVPLETTGVAGASYFKYNNNQATFFAIDHLTYKPWRLTLLAGISANQTKYDRKDLFAIPNLVAGHTADLSFGKKFKTAYTPHFALQKEWNRQIFNLSYSEGYNAPTASSSFIGGKANVVNDGLLPERARMWDFSVQGLLANTKFDYQVSLFKINYQDKLTQMYYNNNTFTYWANTGKQANKGFEASLGYQYSNADGFFNKIVPFFNYSYYDAEYTDFKTVQSGSLQDYSGKRVVGVPKNKYTAGIDFFTKPGLYLSGTFNYLGNVYTDFANTNSVKGFGLLNSKFGFKKSFGKIDMDAYLMGNNLTGQIHYTFLFLGNSINDKDANNGFPSSVATDVNPGPSKAYFFGGLNLKYNF